MFKRILVATDMVTQVDTPVLTAIDLANQYQAKLTVLHVLESASTDNRDLVQHFRTNEVIPVNQGYLDKVRAALKNTYGTALMPSDTIELSICTGYPWQEILSLGRTMDTDLILLGPHSGAADKKGVIRMAGKIGSTVQGVISLQDCPVMIVNKAVHPKKLEFKNIVVGIDFSLSCECGLCFSVKLSHNFNSIIYPFFMLPIPPYPKYARSNYETDMEILKEKLNVFCHRYLDGTPHNYKIWPGVLPHREILKCADQSDADLIILGSHTKVTSGKWYGGSVVERVSFRANCPVFVVNDPKVLQKWDDLPIPGSNEEQATNRSIHLFNKGPHNNKTVHF